VSGEAPTALQVHSAAADTLSQAVLAALDPKPGDTVLDLYCGAAYSPAAVAPRVGPEALYLVEFDSAASERQQNLSRLPVGEVRAVRMSPGPSSRGAFRLPGW